jgi:hypothetical protein
LQDPRKNVQQRGFFFFFPRMISSPRFIEKTENETASNDAPRLHELARLWTVRTTRLLRSEHRGAHAIDLELGLAGIPATTVPLVPAAPAAPRHDTRM